MSSVPTNSIPESDKRINRGQEKAPLLRPRGNFIRRIFNMPQQDNENLIESVIVENGEESGEDNGEVSSPQSPGGLGTFSGVIAPVALSQISTLLFLRLGFLIGHAGYFLSVVCLILAYSILLMTISSISAISTNGMVKGGGVYFMISRTLGPEAGGAIGALLFLANIFSSALYATGALEGVLEIFGETTGEPDYNILPESGFFKYGYKTILNFFNMSVCLIGAGLFAKATTFTLSIVIICVSSVIVSFIGIQHLVEVKIPASNPFYPNATGNYTGFSAETFDGNRLSDFSLDYTTKVTVDFATCFGVLFTGVTGIMAGANMSGELKNPSKSIPSGTTLATVFTGVLYFLLLTLTATTTSRFVLKNDYMFMASTNYWAPFVSVGIITATISASLSCLIGASRVLAALVKDNLYGCFTSWLSTIDKESNPFGSVMFSAVAVQVVFFLGELNTVARFTSVFFLLSYCAVNFACVFLEWASAPNFRPTYTSFSLYTSLAGGFATGILMVYISPIVALVAVLVTVSLMAMIYVYSPMAPYQWGSLSQALIFHQVRKYLLKLDSRKEHVKFWRPKMLLLVANQASSCPLIDFVNDLKKSGLYVVGNVQIQELGPTVAAADGADPDMSLSDAVDPGAIAFTRFKNLVEHLKVKAFVEVAVAPYVSAGVQQLIRLAGVGAMKPNIVIVGFKDESEPFNFLKSETSVYSVVKPQYKTTNRDLVDLEMLKDWPIESSNIETKEYCNILYEAVFHGKNLIIARHFNLFDKEAILSSLSKKSIDIWPMNFFRPDTGKILDICSLFFLNLAQILNMQASWKRKSELRVFICTSSEEEQARKMKEVQEQLDEVRIKASVVNVALPAHVLSMVQHSTPAAPPRIDYSQISDEYLNSINQIIRDNSINTAVSFMYLARPPSPRVSGSQLQYFRCLKTLTEHLHPTLLCYGTDEVTTSHL